MNLIGFPENLKRKIAACLLQTALVLVVSWAFLAQIPAGAFAANHGEQTFTGAPECRACHSKEYGQWIGSGHARILGKPGDTLFSGVPLPEGYGSQDISYIIGGFRWKALYLGGEGRIVTSTPEEPGKNQFNVGKGNWVDYKPGETLPYSCGQCHTTGYQEGGSQGDLPGIQGRWAFAGVQCEGCHGAGARHAVSGGEIPFAAGGSGCRLCHGLEPEDRIPMSGVFLAPYTEYNQLAASPHKGMECQDCHDPHTLTVTDPERLCRSCHEEVATSFKGSFKDKVGLTCIDCHMPLAGIVAAGEPERYVGDLRSHLFRIDHHAPFPAQTEDADGTRTNPGYLPVEYTCIPCHHVFESREWATGFGVNVHNLRVTANVKIMRLQRALTLAGILVALAALLTGLMLRGFIRVGTNKKRTLGLHRVAAWISCSICIFLALLCLYFHFPWTDPARLLNQGVFIIHPFVGAGLFLAYFGKIWVVRRQKKGWKTPGLVMGCLLFLLWVVQSLTVVL